MTPERPPAPPPPRHAEVERAAEWTAAPTHYLIARRPDGGMCSSGRDSEISGPSFRNFHEGHGCTVERVSLDELLERGRERQRRK